MDYGPPIQLLPGKGGVLKIKRGGTGKISNSGTEKKRVRPPVAAIRDAKSGKHLPWPPRGRVIWDPRDPFIQAYRKAHPVVEARWRNPNQPTTGLLALLTPEQQARALHDETGL